MQGQESNIQAQGPIGPLNGTYLSARTPQNEIFLIIPGSGPTDKDGNNPLGVQTNTYKILAENLAQLGFESIRIDKRGVFSSAEAVIDANDVTLEKYVDDVEAWIHSIQILRPTAAIWLIGHSEGGLVALASAARLSSIQGLILMGTPAQKTGDILRQQIQRNPDNAPILEETFTIINALEAGNHVDVAHAHPALQQLFAPAVQGFHIDLMAFDPVQTISTLDLPILILQGDFDIQVEAQNAIELARPAINAEFKIFPRLTHVFKEAEDSSVEANLATYQSPDLPIPMSVISAISDFVTNTPNKSYPRSRRNSGS